MKFVKGPDFPTGCMVCGLEVIKEYFTTGRGSVKVRGKVGVEQLKGGANKSSSRKSPTTSTARCSSSASPNW